jgi:CHAT domain-containing protein
VTRAHAAAIAAAARTTRSDAGRGRLTSPVRRLIEYALLLALTTAPVGAEAADAAAAAGPALPSARSPAGLQPVDYEVPLTRARSLNLQGRGADAVRAATEALTLAEAPHPGDTPQTAASRVARVLRVLATADSMVGRSEAAAGHARRALMLLEQAGLSDHADYARSLSSLGRELYRGGRYGEALQAERNAAERLATLDAPIDLAWALQGMGEIHLAAGDLDAAAARTAEALALFRRHHLPGHIDLARVLHNLARIQRDRFEVAEARLLFDEALVLTEAVNGPDHINVGAVLNNDGLLRLAVGDFEGARQQFERSVAIRRKNHAAGHPEIATGLSNLALLYWSIGNAAAALPLYEEVLQIDRATLGPTHPLLATSLQNIGSALATLGRFDEAMTSIEASRALRVAAFNPRHPTVAQSDLQLGIALRAQGRLAEAEERLRGVVAMLEPQLAPTHPQLSTARVLLALVLLERGRAAEALPLARAAVVTAIGEAGGLALRWMAPFALSRAYAALGETQVAIFWGKQAASEVLAMREGVLRFDRSTQRSLIDRRRPAFTHLIELLLAEGRIAEAQEIYRELKEEEFLDFTLRDARGARAGAATVPLSGAAENGSDAELGRLRTGLRTANGELARLARRARLGLAAEEAARQTQLTAEVAQLTAELDRFALRVKDAFAQTVATAPTAPTDTVLPPGTARVQYVVADRRVLILLHTARGRRAAQAPVSSAELARQIDALRQAIGARADVRPAARVLHDLLIGPLADDLAAAGAQRLELSLDGPLRYLPFAALHDGRAFLVERFVIALRADAADAATRATAASNSAAPGAATPIALQAFGLTRAVPGFAALPAVRREINGIRSHLGSAVDARLDDDFTRDAFLADSLNHRPQRLHVASHFQFRPGTEINSFLLAGDGSRISLRDIRLAGRDFAGVSVVTLSACDTATGGGFDDSGREVEGLANVVLAKGARQVVATLWQVADSATADLIPEVYRRARGAAPDYADALRQAQRELLSRRAVAHPFFWAGFVLIGS